MTKNTFAGEAVSPHQRPPASAAPVKASHQAGAAQSYPKTFTPAGAAMLAVVRGLQR